MFAAQPVSPTAGQPETPFGLRVSAVMLVALGCFLGLYVPVSVAVVLVSLLRASRLQEHSGTLTSLIALIVAAGIMYLCFRAAAALRQLKRWAAYVAMGFGLLLLSFSGLFIYDCFHPERQGPDEYYLVLIVPFFVAAGLWWCIYLNLPRTRALMSTPRRS